MSRRLRAFKRWMKSYGIVYSDALKFVDSTDGGISVRVLCDLKEGDLVDTIPKISCLTIPTSGISSLIEDAGHGDPDASQFFSTQLFANIHRFSEAAI